MLFLKHKYNINWIIYERFRMEYLLLLEFN